MKIVAKSNYDSESFSEYVIAEGLNNYYGKLICEFLQSEVTDYDDVWPELVEDDYELYVWEP